MQGIVVILRGKKSFVPFLISLCFVNIGKGIRKKQSVSYYYECLNKEYTNLQEKKKKKKKMMMMTRRVESTLYNNIRVNPINTLFYLMYTTKRPTDDDPTVL